jgi:hypothetical protein
VESPAAEPSRALRSDEVVGALRQVVEQERIRRRLDLTERIRDRWAPWLLERHPWLRTRLGEPERSAQTEEPPPPALWGQQTLEELPQLARLPSPIAFDISHRVLDRTTQLARRGLVSLIESLGGDEMFLDPTAEPGTRLARLVDGTKLALSLVRTWSWEQARQERDARAATVAEGPDAAVDGGAPADPDGAPQVQGGLGNPRFFIDHDPRFFIEQDLRVVRQLERRPETAEVLAFVRVLREAYQEGLREIAEAPAQEAEGSSAAEERATAQMLLRQQSGPVPDEDWALLASRIAQIRGNGPRRIDSYAVAGLAIAVVNGAMFEPAAEPPQGRRPRGRRAERADAVAAVPADRLGSLWGADGLPGRVRDRLLSSYATDPALVTPTVATMQAFATGDLSDADVAAFLSQRGRRFLASGVAVVEQMRVPRWQVEETVEETEETAPGPDTALDNLDQRFVVIDVPVQLGRERWTSSAVDEPPLAQVRYLDAGFELALHDLAFTAGTSGSTPRRSTRPSSCPGCSRSTGTGCSSSSTAAGTTGPRGSARRVHWPRCPVLRRTWPGMRSASSWPSSGRAGGGPAPAPNRSWPGSPSCWPSGVPSWSPCRSWAARHCRRTVRCGR